MSWGTTLRVVLRGRLVAVVLVRLLVVVAAATTTAAWTVSTVLSLFIFADCSTRHRLVVAVELLLRIRIDRIRVGSSLSGAATLIEDSSLRLVVLTHRILLITSIARWLVALVLLVLLLVLLVATRTVSVLLVVGVVRSLTTSCNPTDRTVVLLLNEGLRLLRLLLRLLLLVILWWRLLHHGLLTLSIRLLRVHAGWCLRLLRWRLVLMRWGHICIMSMSRCVGIGSAMTLVPNACRRPWRATVTRTGRTIEGPRPAELLLAHTIAERLTRCRRTPSCGGRLCTSPATGRRDYVRLRVICNRC